MIAGVTMALEQAVVFFAVFAWYLHRFLPNVSVTSVELDPAVLELARKYFGIRDEPNFQVVNRDGRLFLSESKDKYDIILIDA